MGFKKIIIGEPMPDKNDPKYKERYEKEVEAGKQFAEKSGLNWLAMKIQTLANRHRVGFLVTVFGIVIGCFTINIIGMVRSYNASKKRRATAVEQVDSVLHQRRIIKR
ncbi:MAG: hypothetical protein SOZ07_08395 [Prevotella sp.]|nr:hypothetical protein [Prevotella sp.]